MNHRARFRTRHATTDRKGTGDVPERGTGTMKARHVMSLLLVAGLVSASLLTRAIWAPTAQSAGARVTSVEPNHQPRIDDLLVLNGTGFGSEIGSRIVSLSRTSRDPGDLGRGGISGSSACYVPIVDWTDTRILLLMKGCPAGEYRLGAYTRGGRQEFSVPLVLRREEPAPPVAGGEGRRWITLVHPELARPGQLLDVYGDFPNPDPGTDRVFVQPGRMAAAANAPPATLRPIETFRPHIRARLPYNAPPGEYAVFVSKHNGIMSTGQRLIIRSTEPAAWEHVSALRYSRPVQFRLVGAVPYVGVERRQMDVLGLNLDMASRSGGVHILSDQELQNMISNLRHAGDSTAPLFGIPAWLCAVAWSETKVRVEERQAGSFSCGGNLPQGTFNVAIRQVIDGKDRWSNAVRIRIPERP
jgi:hypothetical protein